tara:strand:- start:401 stop:598 length:198 start_codon:yes stop_codon:yes gene_type:complete
MYSIRLVDENENILLSIRTDSINLSRRSDQKMLCQKMSEVMEEKDKNQLEMDLSDVKDGVVEWEK